MLLVSIGFNRQLLHFQARRPTHVSPSLQLVSFSQEPPAAREHGMAILLSLSHILSILLPKLKCMNPMPTSPQPPGPVPVRHSRDAHGRPWPCAHIPHKPKKTNNFNAKDSAADVRRKGHHVALGGWNELHLSPKTCSNSKNRDNS